VALEECRGRLGADLVAALCVDRLNCLAFKLLEQVECVCLLSMSRIECALACGCEERVSVGCVPSICIVCRVREYAGYVNGVLQRSGIPQQQYCLT
jgi:hypothetical protein